MINFKFQKTTKFLLLLSIVAMLAAGCTTAQPRNNARQNATADSAQPSAVKLTVYQTVADSNLNQPAYSATAGETAMDLLKATNQVQVKSYGSMGEFVESINGIKPDGKHFWEFFVNGKSSNVGAGAYTLKDSDKIEWKLSAIK